MTYIIFFVTVFLFPFLFWLHTNHVEDIQKKRVLKKRDKFISIWSILFFSLIIVFIILLWASENHKKNEPDFYFFQVNEYINEIESFYPNKKGSNEVIENSRLFSFADNFYKIKKYVYAENIYKDLKLGYDKNGPLLKLDSYIVDNNLGIISYYSQKDNHIKCLEYLLLASRKKHISSYNLQIIDRNIFSLFNSLI